MTPDASTPELHLQLAVSTLEAEDWTVGIGLLIGVLNQVEGIGAWRIEATARALLAQALYQTGQAKDGRVQAQLALAAAEQTDEGALIHRCMALLQTFAILDRDRL